MNPIDEYIQHETRRQFFAKAGLGLGTRGTRKPHGR